MVNVTTFALIAACFGLQVAQAAPSKKFRADNSAALNGVHAPAPAPALAAKDLSNVAGGNGRRTASVFQTFEAVKCETTTKEAKKEDKKDKKHDLKKKEGKEKVSKDETPGARRLLGVPKDGVTTKKKDSSTRRLQEDCRECKNKIAFVTGADMGVGDTTLAYRYRATGQDISGVARDKIIDKAEDCVHSALSNEVLEDGDGIVRVQSKPCDMPDIDGCDADECDILGGVMLTKATLSNSNVNRIQGIIESALNTCEHPGITYDYQGTAGSGGRLNNNPYSMSFNDNGSTYISLLPVAVGTLLATAALFVW